MYAQAILIDFNVFAFHLCIGECLIELGEMDAALYSLQLAESFTNEDEEKQKCKVLLERLKKDF